MCTLNTRPPHHLEMQINLRQVILPSQRWLPAPERGLAANCSTLNPSKSHQNWPQSGTTSSQRSRKIEITTTCSVGLHFYVQFKGLFICLLWFFNAKQLETVNYTHKLSIIMQEVIKITKPRRHFTQPSSPWDCTRYIKYIFYIYISKQIFLIIFY